MRFLIFFFCPSICACGANKLRQWHLLLSWPACPSSQTCADRLWWKQFTRLMQPAEMEKLLFLAEQQEAKAGVVCPPSYPSPKPPFDLTFVAARDRLTGFVWCLDLVCV